MTRFGSIRSNRFRAVCGFVLASAVVAGVAVKIRSNQWRQGPADVKVVTFNEHVAPILFKRCASCHQPGQPGPFALLDYHDAFKRAAQISEVTRRRVMPPWMPDSPAGVFQGDPRLTDDEIRLLSRWATEGKIEGPGAPPPAPAAEPEWTLGKPDLIVQMDRPYTLAAEGESGRDVYRNFVLPVPLDRTRYVRAVEIRPGNPRCVHHVLLLADRFGEAAWLAGREPQPGYGGMGTGDGPAAPDGHLLGWQPGRKPVVEGDDLAWKIAPGTDLVLQTHLRPTGRAEEVRPVVGLYLTDRPPAWNPVQLMLRTTAIDIPAGESNFVAESSYTLPVDIAILAVLPHAHYLGKSLQAWADLPDGTRRSILRIPDWDFNWQREYRFFDPLSIPKGSRLRMRYAFDNSDSNPRNPHHPPRRTTYGLQTDDEMSELWMQVLPAHSGDLAALKSDYKQKWLVPDSLAWSANVLRLHPADLDASVSAAANLATHGRTDEALEQLQRTSAEHPDDAKSRYLRGAILIRRGQTAAAKECFRDAIRVVPDHPRANCDLGFLLLSDGEAGAAIPYLETAVDSTPRDILAQTNLGRAYLASNRPADAVPHFEAALRLDRENALAKAGLDRARELMAPP